MLQEILSLRIDDYNSFYKYKLFYRQRQTLQFVLVFTEIKPAKLSCQYYNNNHADSIIPLYQSQNPIYCKLDQAPNKIKQKISNAKGNEW